MATKRQLKEIAKERLVDALAIAYYALDENEAFICLDADEKQQVLVLTHKYGKAMCKAISKEYYTM